jgi:hypothetical protein
MLLTDVLARYGDFAIRLGIDLAAILLLSYALYFRRHWRADLLSSYIALNVGIFTVMSLLSIVRVDIAVGFGLFAILSIIRLRSSTVTQQEVGYYFIALVLGLVNGLKVDDRGLVVTINVLLLVVMLVFDSKSLRTRSERLDVKLDKVYTDRTALVAELERQLGGHVVYHEVSEIDLIHHHMTVDVRLRPGPGGTTHRHEQATTETHPTTVTAGNGAAPAVGTGDAVRGDAN